MKHSLLPALILLLIVRCSFAAMISEVTTASHDVLNPQSKLVTISPYIEISELSGMNAVDLVIIDARDSISRYGQILQVITLPTGPDVRIASQSAFPDTALYGAPLPGHPITITPDALNLTGSRSILLFDRAGLSAGSKLDLTQTASAGDQLLDFVTFGSAATTRALNHEEIFDMSGVTAFAKTYSNHTLKLPDVTLTGNPDQYNRLRNISPIYALNPGLANETWKKNPPAPVPLPAAWKGILACMGVYMVFGFLSRRAARN